MRDLPTQQPEVEYLSTREVAAQDEVIHAATDALALTDMQIGVDRFRYYLEDWHEAAELLPLVSAVASGDWVAAELFVTALRARYAEQLRADDDVVHAILAEHGEEHGHA